METYDERIGHCNFHDLDTHEDMYCDAWRAPEPEPEVSDSVVMARFEESWNTYYRGWGEMENFGFDDDVDGLRKFAEAVYLDALDDLREYFPEAAAVLELEGKG